MARPLKTPKAILRAALKLLEKRGWTKNMYQEGVEGAVCLVGALHCAASGESDWYASGDPDVTPALNLIGFKNEGAATKWNDRTTRQFHHVKARIEKALAQ